MKGRQVDEVQDLISKAAGVTFEIVNPPAEHPLPISDVEWFMRCRALDDIKKSPYLNSAWKERDGPIWMESLMLGDTFTWIESAYGEEAAVASMDMNFTDFTSKESQARFSKQLPLVYRRIETYQGVVEGAAKKHKVHMKLRESGSKGIVVFSILANVDSKRERLAERIGKAIDAMKEAYAQIGEV